MATERSEVWGGDGMVALLTTLERETVCDAKRCDAMPRQRRASDTEVETWVDVAVAVAIAIAAGGRA